MIKSEGKIVTEIWKYVSNSELATAINGEIYKSRNRPLNSNTVDIVIKPIANTPSQRQLSYINCNIYIPDEIDDGQYDKNGEECDRLEEIAARVLEVFSIDGARIVLDTQHTYQVTDAHAHVINNRLFYQFINE